jgi:hypothetical protein
VIRATGAVVVALVVGACSPPARPVFPAALVAAAPGVVAADEAHAWIERGRAYEQATGNFSAVVGVTVRDIDRAQTFEARGGIAVHRPESMRMQMSAAGGVTAVDLLARDDSYWLRLAGRDWVRGRLDEQPAHGFPAGSLARSFLGVDWNRATAVSSTGSLGVLRAPTPEGHALVTLEVRDGTEREIRWFEGDQERVRVRFAEFEPDEHGVRWPRVVLFWQARPDVSATITVHTRTNAPTLPPQTFAPPI